MNENFPPNIDPQTFSLTAVIVGTVLVGNFSANELNSIANWILLVGQYLDTVAAQEQLIEGRVNNLNNQQQEAFNNENINKQFNNIQKAISIIQDELEKLKNRQ